MQAAQGQRHGTGRQRPHSPTDCCVTLGPPLPLSGPQCLDKKAPQTLVALASMTTRWKGGREGLAGPPEVGGGQSGTFSESRVGVRSSFRRFQFLSSPESTCSENRVSQQLAAVRVLRPTPSPQGLQPRLSRQAGSPGVTPTMRTAAATREAGTWHKHSSREGAKPILGPQTSPGASVHLSVRPSFRVRLDSEAEPPFGH